MFHEIKHFLVLLRSFGYLTKLRDSKMMLCIINAIQEIIELVNESLEKRLPVLLQLLHDRQNVEIFVPFVVDAAFEVHILGFRSH